MTPMSIEISYTLRYPEYKPKEDRWTIRQSGIYHRYDRTSSQSLFVLFSPTPQSKAHCKAEELLSTIHPELVTDSFWLHRVLFEVYFPAWRSYIAMLERRFLPLATSAIAAFIDGPLSLGYDSLSTLNSLESRFLQIPAILESATDTLDELCTLLGSASETAATQSGIQCFKNQRRHCIAYSHSAAHLQRRVEVVSKLLADTLLFRDQVLAKEQNRNILRLNKSAVFITTLTLFYLPSSFMAVSLLSLHSFSPSRTLSWFFFSESYPCCENWKLTNRTVSHNSPYSA